MSRTKGAQAEREVVRLLIGEGYQARRTAILQTHGVHGAADVAGIPGCHLEIKRQETICMEKWCHQAEADAPAGQIPVVVWRRSKQPWRVTLPLLDFLKLHRKATR